MHKIKNRKKCSSKMRKDRQRLSDLSAKSVSMQNFLVRFLGVRDINLLQSCITHKDLKSIFPDLKRTGFDTILDSPELVASGRVILVNDSQNVVPYSVPSIKLDMSDVLCSDDWQDSEVWDRSSEEKNVDINEYDLQSLNIYNLVELMELYARTRQMGCYYAVRRELISRDDSKHATKHSKARALQKDLKRRRRNEEEDY